MPYSECWSQCAVELRNILSMHMYANQYHPLNVSYVCIAKDNPR